MRFDPNIENIKDLDSTLSFSKNPEEIKTVIKDPLIWKEID